MTVDSVGRQKKLHGKLFVNLEGRRVRIKAGYVPASHVFTRHAPRGKTGAAWDLASVLKERAPLIYVFIVNELRKPHSERNPTLQNIIEEWKEDNAQRKLPPNAREMTAYVLERAFDGAWEVWELKRPYNDGEPESFYRRYVQGHPGAIRDYREALRMPQPWPQNHVGREVLLFLGQKGDAARHYGFLTRESKRARVVIIEDE